MAIEVALAVADLLVSDEIRQEVNDPSGTLARSREVNVGQTEFRKDRSSGSDVDHAPLGRSSANLLALGVGDPDTPVVGKAAALDRPDLYIVIVIKHRALVNLERGTEKNPGAARVPHHVNAATFLADVLTDGVDDAAAD